jgi:hypothetical protein
MVEELFIIERGGSFLEDVDQADAVEELMVNTADAYGFPPFQHIAPAVVLGDADYAELQRVERSILRSVMTRVRARRLASDGFTWADEIPRLLAEDAAEPSTDGAGVVQGNDDVTLLNGNGHRRGSTEAEDVTAAARAS